jgi:WD40 repeat protein/tRNA A-37 threonylcarbamoyl transferase component Bud32
LVGDFLGPDEVGPGSLVAEYRIEARIGAGGMAVVYRARDERLPRLAALKVMAPQWAADEEFRQRFIAESRASTTVDHPHVIPVYKAGEAGGVLFIAMRLVTGGDLRELMRREGGARPAARALDLLSPVASALDAAHATGLVHRDVKPGNILIDRRPRQSDHVFLSDFGLSKGVLSGASLTQSGHYLGTPHYSAPEQAQGDHVDGRADQYALACVAFELLTGRRVFERDDPLAVLLAHVTAPPPALSERRPDLPAAADGVMRRALAKTPDDRYPSCRDFTDALRNALVLETAGQRGRPGAGAPAAPVTAAPAPAAPTPAAPARGGSRRNRLLVIAAAGAVLAAAIAVPLALAAMPGTANASHATTTRTPAGAPTPTLSRPASPAGSAVASPSATARPRPNPLTATLTDPSGESNGNNVLSVAFAPSGTTLAAGDASGLIHLWNTASKKRTALTDPNGEGVNALAFAASGSTLAAGDQNGSVYLWNTTAKTLTATLTAPKPGSAIGGLPTMVSTVAFSPDGTTLAVADVYGDTYLWNTATGTVNAILADPGNAGSVDSLAFAPDGTTLATGNFAGNVSLWNTTTGKLIATLTDPDGADVQSVAFAPHGTTLAAGGELGTTYLWNTATGKVTASLANPAGAPMVDSVAFAPRGAVLAVGGDDGSTSFWNTGSRKLIATFTGPGTEGATSVAFSPSGTVTAAGDKNGSIYLWRVPQ